MKFFLNFKDMMLNVNGFMIFVINEEMLDEK